MNIVWLSLAFVLIVFLSWTITSWANRYALNNSIMDHPNQRSLHYVPMPRGGGLSIALLILFGIVILWACQLLSIELTMAAFIGGSLVALIGWLDDRSNFPIVIRALFYLLASVWSVYWMLGMSFGTNVNNILLILCLILGIAWLTNLYNFMDGSDGVAALQAISSGIMGGVFLIYVNETGLVYLLLVIIASSTGFLIWNWPPARIFMGDVGSCLLGFIYSIIIIETYIKNILPLTIWLILFSFFICDASLTLLYRVASGKEWYRAHRQHGYQLYIQMGKSHKQLIYVILSINMIFLYPMSFFAFNYSEYQWWITLAVYSLLTSIWITIQIKYKNNSQKETIS
ncbi:MAG: Fuc2NAc and GlcNAc transferase [Gammaproteobacteria bacterium]|jgi:Fuc2NAc and GlcNAc transferase